MLVRPATYLPAGHQVLITGGESVRMLDMSPNSTARPKRNAAADATQTRLQPTRPPSPFNQAYPHSGLENRT